MGKFVRNFLGSFLLLRALCMDLWTESVGEKTQQLHAAEESMLGTSTQTLELARARTKVRSSSAPLVFSRA